MHSNTSYAPSSAKIKSTSPRLIFSSPSKHFRSPCCRIIRKFRPSSGIACSAPRFRRGLSRRLLA